MSFRASISLAILLASSRLSIAAQKPFSVYDDVLAFPQFEIVFPDEYILESEARSLLEQPFDSKSSASVTASLSSSSTQEHNPSELEQQVPLHNKRDEGKSFESDTTQGRSIEAYEEMILHGQKFLCEMPTVKDETVESTTSRTHEEKELARATDRGLELLREMEGKCMYYAAGWWSYSFCYMDEVRQFHAILPGNGVPAYPPLEDRTTHSFVLGKFRKPTKEKDDTPAKKKPTTEVAVRETRGDSWYLVQYLEDGTTCDLTNRPRKIEVQFHCHPHASDHIGWIKEVSTCSYLMVIYTPRLCNDVAFQPPRVDKPHDIVCREILTPEEVPEWEAAKEALDRQDLLGEPVEEYPLIGDIEVGAMKLVGKEGKRIEKGKVASPVEEKVEVIARSQKGEFQRVSKDQLKKLKLDPEEIESARTQLDEIAEGQDWKLEVVDVNGARTLRGIIEDEEEESTEEESTRDDVKANENHKEQNKESEQPDAEPDEDGEANEDDFETGSEERLKEEL